MSQHATPPTPPTPAPQTVGAAPKTSILAILSLVLGIIGLCTAGIGGLIGLVLGLVAMMRIKGSEGRIGGNGLAIAGVSVSAAAVLFGCLSLALLLPALGKARIEAKNMMMQSQMRMLSNAAIVYAIEHRDSPPPPDDWLDVLVEEGFISDPDDMVSHPGDEMGGRIIAMNAALAGRTLESIEEPFMTVLFFEVAPGSPLAGGPELMAPEPFHPGGYVIGFVDGHVEQYDGALIPTLRWE